MKTKLTLGFVALTVSSAAFSQTGSPTVELYGIADAGVMRVSGLRGGSASFLASGIMEGTRWGLRGNEDLGGGWRALFTLESRVEIDTGGTSNRPLSGTQLPDRVSVATLMGLPASMQPFVTAVGASIANASAGVNLPNRLFDRQAYVGLVTPVGGILAGRMYTPAYELNANFDIMKTESSLAAGQVGSFPPTIDIRHSNSLAYRIQKDGITGSLMYSMGEIPGSNSKGRFWGAMAMYKSSGFSAGLAYNTRNNELGAKSLTTFIGGASVNVGSGAFNVMAASIKDKNPSDLSTIAATLNAQTGNTAVGGPVQSAFINALKLDGQLLHVGYRRVMGPNTISVAYTQYNDKRPSNADTASYGVAYTYALSKRTDVNAVLTRFNNSGLGQAAPGQAGFLGGVTETAGRDSTSLALGLRHRF
ncbi:MAG: porin [Burkholderiales bacterium]